MTIEEKIEGMEVLFNTKVIMRRYGWGVYAFQVSEDYKDYFKLMARKEHNYRPSDVYDFFIDTGSIQSVISRESRILDDEISQWGWNEYRIPKKKDLSGVLLQLSNSICYRGIKRDVLGFERADVNNFIKLGYGKYSGINPEHLPQALALPEGLIDSIAIISENSKKFVYGTELANYRHQKIVKRFDPVVELPDFSSISKGKDSGVFLFNSTTGNIIGKAPDVFGDGTEWIYNYKDGELCVNPFIIPLFDIYKQLNNRGRFPVPQDIILSDGEKNYCFRDVKMVSYMGPEECRQNVSSNLFYTYDIDLKEDHDKFRKNELYQITKMPNPAPHPNLTNQEIFEAKKLFPIKGLKINGKSASCSYLLYCYNGETLCFPAKTPRELGRDYVMVTEESDIEMLYKQISFGLPFDLVAFAKSAILIAKELDSEEISDFITGMKQGIVRGLYRLGQKDEFKYDTKRRIFYPVCHDSSDDFLIYGDNQVVSTKAESAEGLGHEYIRSFRGWDINIPPHFLSFNAPQNLGKKLSRTDIEDFKNGIYQEQFG